MTVVAEMNHDAPRARRNVGAISGVRLVSTVLAIIAICCFAAAAGHYGDANMIPNHTAPGYIVELDIISIVVLFLSIAWNAGNFLHQRITRRPIHPGARVAFELLLWVGQVLVAIAVTTGTITYYNDPAEPASDFFKNLQWSGNTMLILTGILIFSLFVYACHDTHLRRRNRGQIQIVKSVGNVELVPTAPALQPTSVIVACDCQYYLESDHVAGSSNDHQLPQYSSISGQRQVVDEGKPAAGV